MPDYNLIELAVKALAGEARSFQERGASVSAAEHAKLAESLNGLVATVMDALTEEKDAGGRAKAAELLKTLVALQSGLSATSSGGQGNAASPVSAAASTASPQSALEADGYQLYKLPSGVEVYSRKLPNGTTSDYYYCPTCLPKGKTATLEFKFGSGGKYVCPRCTAAYSISASAAPPVPPPTTSTQDQFPDDEPGTYYIPAPEAPVLAPSALPLASKKECVLPPVFGGANGVRTWHVSRTPTPGVEIEAPKNYSPARARLMRWWTNFGQGGFLTSIFVHLILVIILMAWVISIPSGNKQEDISTFQTASGGPKGDASIRFKDKTQTKTIRDMAKRNPMRIALSKPSALSLPELPMQNSLFSGGAKGSLNAALGGEGDGSGFGKGKGRWFTPQMVMGLRISARNIAVYLDNSGSMVPYLKPVKAEILKGFPNADIYEHDGIRINVRDGKVEHGRPSGNSIYSTSEASNNIEYLHEKYQTNFDAGSIGAWMDIMLFQGYDALVVFSDFQDGVEQSDTGRGLIFADTPFTKIETRRATDKKWEEEWIARCKLKPGGPRIYLFSIEEMPQKIWQDCVKASGGEIKMKPNLRVGER